MVLRVTRAGRRKMAEAQLAAFREYVEKYGLAALSAPPAGIDNAHVGAIISVATTAVVDGYVYGERIEVSEVIAEWTR